MEENKISELILDAAFKVHRKIGPGLLESCYEQALIIEMEKLGLVVMNQVPFPFVYENKKREIGFRADLVVNEKVIIEIKSIESIAPIHNAQVLTYLRLSGLKLGILINFNSTLLKNQIKRVVNKL
ncbi:MAG: GxxExxY protein [Saprospiraceae bacterium]